MPMFYTHVLHGTDIARDEEGQEFATLDEARLVGLRAAGDMVAEEVAAGHYHVDLELRIHDEANTLLITLPVSASVIGLGPV